MIKNDYVIRLEEKADYYKTEYLVRESFWNVYRPGCSEHYVLKCLRDDADFVPQLDFVMEKDGQIIGQIVFVKAAITKDGGGVLPVLTFGPICIEKSYQKKGYGKILLDYALDKATEMGFGAVFIEGNINFYRHCGLTYAREYGISYHGLPDGADEPTDEECVAAVLADGRLGAHFLYQIIILLFRHADPSGKRMRKISGNMRNLHKIYNFHAFPMFTLC